MSLPKRLSTWFSHPDTMPRTDHPRDILLSNTPYRWVEEIIQRWADWIDPAEPVNLHVVHPRPPGGQPEVIAHVLLVQKPTMHTRVALVTVTETLEDPWHPERFCALLPPLVSLDYLAEEAMVPTCFRAPHHGCHLFHGQTEILSNQQFPVRHGYSFELIVDSLDDHRDSTSLIQLSFRTIRRQINNIRSRVEAELSKYPWIVALPTHGPPSIELPPSATLPGTALPQRSPGGSALVPDPFRRRLQQRWRALAMVMPAATGRRAPIITWYLDHVRYPECTAARVVFLYENPQEWTQLMARQWQDILLPQVPVYFHVVTPDPDAMEPQFLAHVLIVQQPMDAFVSALITVFDSAMPGQLRRHATMMPTPLHFSTLLGVACLDQDCLRHRNVCEAWEADRPFAPAQVVDSHNGHPFTVAIHRHLLPAAEDQDPWEDAKETTRDHPVILCLTASLPLSSSKVEFKPDKELPQLLWFEDEAWLIRLQAESPCCLLPLPEGLTVPSESYWSLIAPTHVQRHTPESYTLYLDGSSSSINAGWSVIVTCFIESQETFIGCIYGTVQINEQQPDWYGAHTTDNVAGELTALACAQNLAIRWPFPQRVCIRPDLQLSKTVAESTTTCKSNSRLAQICRAQGGWLTNLACIEEVRGHSGNAWNELADAVAKHAMRHAQNPAQDEFRMLHAFAQCQHDVNWAWMQTTHPAVSACFPMLQNQQVLHFEKPTRSLAITPVELQAPPAADSQQQWMLQIRSANVLAAEVWDTKSTGSKRTGQRTVRLDQQWHLAGAHAIGVQEARTMEGRSSTPHYMVFASGAKTARAPLYGCELWIHRTLPVCFQADGTPITFASASFVVQHADPRRLFVEARLHRTVYAFVVLHAPCLGTPVSQNVSPKANINNWWEETSALYHKLIRTSLCWIMVDANAPLGDGDGVHFGPVGSEPLSRHTDDFANFILEHNLFVPSTFQHLHQGQTTTWTHATGTRSRKDYILVPLPSATLATKSWVDTKHDSTFSHEDHLPVVLECQGWMPVQGETAPYKWDEQALIDPARCQQFRRTCHPAPPNLGCECR